MWVYKRRRKRILFLFFFLLLLFVFSFFTYQLKTVFNTLSQSKVYAVSLQAINNVVNKKMSEIDYNSLITFQKKENEEITIANTNIVLMNQLSNEISHEIISEMDKLEALYNKIGYVSQKPVIFNMTVKDNVSYGKNGKKKTESNIINAIKVAQASEFVLKMDKKYDTMIAQGGTNISGGQKQRLSIARAIARDPEIYIFDDSFSALDYKTDYDLRRELKKHTKDATCLIVAQRIGTIMHSDKILVLDNGRCVGMGTHEELLENCDVYRQIALSQLSLEELKNAKNK